MRKMQWMAVVGVFLAACLPAVAQFSDLKVNIPFEFQVGEDKVPAGTYTFAQETRNDKMLCTNGKQRLLIPTSPLPPESVFAKAHTLLVFHRAGDKYFLYQLWTKHFGYQMPTSAAEKEIASSGGEIKEVHMNVKF